MDGCRLSKERNDEQGIEYYPYGSTLCYDDLSKYFTNRIIKLPPHIISSFGLLQVHRQHLQDEQGRVFSRSITET